MTGRVFGDQAAGHGQAAGGPDAAAVQGHTVGVDGTVVHGHGAVVDNGAAPIGGDRVAVERAAVDGENRACGIEDGAGLPGAVLAEGTALHGESAVVDNGAAAALTAGALDPAVLSAVQDGERTVIGDGVAVCLGLAQIPVQDMAVQIEAQALPRRDHQGCVARCGFEVLLQLDDSSVCRLVDHALQRGPAQEPLGTHLHIHAGHGESKGVSVPPAGDFSVEQIGDMGFLQGTARIRSRRDRHGLPCLGRGLVRGEGAALALLQLHLVIRIGIRNIDGHWDRAKFRVYDVILARDLAEPCSAILIRTGIDAGLRMFPGVGADKSIEWNAHWDRI